jgi:hypothetical protein
MDSAFDSDSEYNIFIAQKWSSDRENWELRSEFRVFRLLFRKNAFSRRKIFFS